MADYRRHEIVSGLFVLGATIVFLLFAFLQRQVRQGFGLSGLK